MMVCVMGRLRNGAVFFAGGDEVSFDCWNENSEVAAFMKSKGYSGADLENYYEGMQLRIVPDLLLLQSILCGSAVCQASCLCQTPTVTADAPSALVPCLQDGYWTSSGVRL